MAIVEDLADSESDEYLPRPDPLPKLDNKRKPSAIRIAAQHCCDIGQTLTYSTE